jgi:hypothetical protein
VSNHTVNIEAKAEVKPLTATKPAMEDMPSSY